MSPDLAIIVISYNTKDLLQECLRSVFNAKAHSLLEVEVMVVDNHSTDKTLEMIRTKFSLVKLIANDSNLGFARACNQALKSSNKKYVLLLNSDTQIFPGSLDALINFMESHQEAGVLGPLLTNPDGSVQYSCRNFPSFIDATMHAFLGVLFPSNTFSRRYKMADWDRSSERCVDWVSGAAMCLRQQALKEVGYFDENYFMYVEDMDLCYRMWKAGWKVYFTPKTQVLHHIGQSTKQQSTAMIIKHQKSMYRFYSKRYQNSPWGLLKFLVAVGLAVRTCFLVFLNLLRGIRVTRAS